MEEWRDVFGYEGLYQVSSEGRVRSLGWCLTGAVERRASVESISVFFGWHESAISAMAAISAPTFRRTASHGLSLSIASSASHFSA